MGHQWTFIVKWLLHQEKFCCWFVGTVVLFSDSFSYIQCTYTAHTCLCNKNENSAPT